MGRARRVLKEAEDTGPRVTTGESPIDPTPLPNPDAPSAQDLEAVEVDAEIIDGGEIEAAPVLTPEALVQSVEDLVVGLALVTAMVRNRELTEDDIEALRLTPRERLRLSVWAPSAAPYLQQSAATLPYLGLAMFGVSCVSIVIAKAKQNGTPVRVAPISERHLDDAHLSGPVRPIQTPGGPIGPKSQRREAPTPTQGMKWSGPRRDIFKAV